MFMCYEAVTFEPLLPFDLNPESKETKSALWICYFWTQVL